MSDFRYPNITGRTNGEKIDQIVSFLRQLVDQLNYENSYQEANASNTEKDRILAAIREQKGITE